VRPSTDSSGPAITTTNITTTTFPAWRSRLLSAAATLQTRSKVTFSFVTATSEVVEVEAEMGANILDVAHDNDIEMEGACGGECACSTCHVILEQPVFDELLKKVPIQEEEEDMLDLAPGLTDTSRLGCQCKVGMYFQGARIHLPAEVGTFYHD
jgi:ferredoxin